MDKKTFVILAVLFGLLILAFFAYQPSTSTTSSSGDVGASSDVMVQYDAECRTRTQTVLGVVTLGGGLDPQQAEFIDVENRNNGKVTKIKPAEATCRFTPVSQ